MPFNFGSLFSAVGRALPGFVEGERAAIQDNWRDLNEYNKVQAGQLENAWTEATWDPRYMNVWNQATNNDIMTQASAMELANRVAAQPGMQVRARRFSDYAPTIYDGLYGSLPQVIRRAAQMGIPMADPAASLQTPSLGR